MATVCILIFEICILKMDVQFFVFVENLTFNLKLNMKRAISLWHTFIIQKLLRTYNFNELITLGYTALILSLW